MIFFRDPNRTGTTIQEPVQNQNLESLPKNMEMEPGLSIEKHIEPESEPGTFRKNYFD